MHQQFSQPRFFIFSNHFQNQHANNLIQKPNRLSTLYRKILILKQFSNKRTNEPTYFLNLDSHFLFQILSYCRCNMYYHPRFPNIFKHWAIPKSEINTQTYKKKWGREGWKIDWREGSEKNLVTAGYGNANGTGVGRASGYRRPHRVYNAVVSKSRNKWSRRGTAKKNRGARRPNYPLPAVVVVVVSRGAGGFGGGGGRIPSAEAEGSWNQVSRGNGLIGGVPRMIFDLRRRGGCPPPADHFFESGGGAAERGWQRSEQRGG